MREERIPGLNIDNVAGGAKKWKKKSPELSDKEVDEIHRQGFVDPAGVFLKAEDSPELNDSETVSTTDETLYAEAEILPKKKEGKPLKERVLTAGRQVAEFLGGEKAKSFFEARDVEKALEGDSQILALQEKSKEFKAKKEELRLLVVDYVKLTADAYEKRRKVIAVWNGIKELQKRIDILGDDVDLIEHYRPLLEAKEQELKSLEDQEKLLGQQVNDKRTEVETAESVLREFARDTSEYQMIIRERDTHEFLEKTAVDNGLEANEQKISELEQRVQDLEKDRIQIAGRLDVAERELINLEKEKGELARVSIDKLKGSVEDRRFLLKEVTRELKGVEKDLEKARLYSTKISGRIEAITKVTDRMGLGEVFEYKIEENNQSVSEGEVTPPPLPKREEVSGVLHASGKTSTKYTGGGGSSHLRTAVERKPKKKKGFFSSLFGNWFN